MGLVSDKAELVHFVTFVNTKVFVARILHVIGKKLVISMLVLMHLCIGYCEHLYNSTRATYFWAWDSKSVSVNVNIP